MSQPWTENIILTSDSYKISHWRQYPKGTEYVYSYFESRGCDNQGWDSVVFFGLQYFLKRYMAGPVVTQAKIEEAAGIYAEHFGDGVNNNESMFYREGWEHILKAHGGRLPLTIKAVPEGMVIPNKTVLMTIVNTDPKAFWLTNFMETLLVQVWYPMTVCTNSRMQKISIHKYLEATGNEDWAIPGGAAFKLHDFGFRGVSSVESAALGGMGHLVNFMGTDTVAALVAANKYYKANKACGYSVPASEHSTITSWGVDGELDAMRNMLEQYPAGIVACVSDSFDVYNACQNYWGDQLKELIKGRISGDKWGRLVVRPDSGDPADICAAINGILCEQFAEDVTITRTGHKLLPPYIRILQGDGVDWESIPAILERLANEGFAADNMVFGSGGSLLQKLNRDTFKCAFKCAEITVNGQARDVFKDPVTDNGKASKKGRLTLQLASECTGFMEEDVYMPRQGPHGVKGGTGCLHFSKDGELVTVADGRGDPSKDLMVEVFRDGDILKEWTMDEIRRRADIEGGPFQLAAASEAVNAEKAAAARAVDMAFADRAESDRMESARLSARERQVSEPPAGNILTYAAKAVTSAFQHATAMPQQASMAVSGGVARQMVHQQPQVLQPKSTSPQMVLRPAQTHAPVPAQAPVRFAMPAVDALSRSVGRTFVSAAAQPGYPATQASMAAPSSYRVPAMRSSSFVGGNQSMLGFKSYQPGAPVQSYTSGARPGNFVSYSAAAPSVSSRAQVPATASYRTAAPTIMSPTSMSGTAGGFSMPSQRVA
eukprot:TRINITY_DN1744_c2_g1_i1.p2 TRINITY_DN1744_c2_g1~~TRINITY_DN1744_c2_g1_i1.p2  ORF type:complete len:773 (+),score=207.43 TRINITY_DN1744_c2_g1_i1:83-2401(+)